LAETLDYLPLALEQAAASIRTGKSFNKYLNEFRQHKLKILETYKRKTSTYPYTVATTWELSFKEIKKQSSTVKALLKSWHRFKQAKKDSSTTTALSKLWSDFKHFKQQSSAAMALLNLCAFLAPDDIPYDLFEQNGIPLKSIISPLAEHGALDLARVTLRT